MNTQLEPENAAEKPKPLPAGSAMVWAEPIERADLRLVTGDITKAITWFRDKTGCEPKLIILNRKSECFAKEAGDGIKVNYSVAVLPRKFGCLLRILLLRQS